MKLPSSINVGGLDKPKFRLKALPSERKIKERLDHILYYLEVEAALELPIIQPIVNISEAQLPKGLMPYSIRSVLYQICTLASDFEEDLCITTSYTQPCILASGLEKKN